MKKYFTLIELITVIVVLGILAAIVTMNIQDLQKDSITSMVKSNTRILQTASDTYKLKNLKYPTFQEPTLEQPQLIDIDRLYPDYIKSKPDYDKVKNQLYWVDVFGQVWGATVNSPSNIYKTNNSLEWAYDKNVVAYNLYSIQGNITTGKATKSFIRLNDTFNIKKEADRIKLEFPQTNFLLSSIDEYGLESAPSGLYNQKAQDWFTPIMGKKGEFEFILESYDMMYWDEFSVLEDKPIGTDIKYSFSIQNDKGEYGAFTENFYSLSPSKGIKVKVNMISNGNKLPTLWDMQVYYHYLGAVDTSLRVGKTTITESKNLQDHRSINPEQPVYIEEHFTLPTNMKLKEVKVIDSYPTILKSSSSQSNTSNDNDTTENGYSVKYYYKSPNRDFFVPIVSFNEVPVGSEIKITKNYPSGVNLYASPTIIEYDNKVIVNNVQGKITDPELQSSEWNTIDTMNFFAHSSDGQKTHWLSIDKKDTQPVNTRIVYRYAYNTAKLWSDEISDFSKIPDSRSVRVSAYFQVKADMVGRVTDPSIQSIRITHERGSVDLDLVKPTVSIIPITNNNQLNDYFSDTTKVQWAYETTDPRNRSIINVEWAGDKREQYPVGIYEVKLRVQNSSNYWSDWVSYKFQVKQEKPVAVINMTDMYLINAPIAWDETSSYDPDNDGQLKFEWTGDKKISYSERGDYTVQLRVQDKEGNWSDTVSKIIKIRDISEFNKGVGNIDLSLYTKVWYVSPAGDNLNSGDIDNPLKDIHIAINKAQSKDAIFVKEGTYYVPPIKMDNTYRSVALTDYGKDLTFIGEGKYTTIVYDAKFASTRDSNLFEFWSVNSKVIGMHFNFIPGKATNYSNAICRQCNATFYNLFIDITGPSTTASYNYYNGEWGLLSNSHPYFYNTVFNFNNTPVGNYSGRPYFVNSITDKGFNGIKTNSLELKEVYFNNVESLKSDISVKNKGNDGTDIGVYGGYYYWK